jgi:hypothetical protein
MAKSNILKKVSSGTQGIFNVIPKEVRVSLAVVGGTALAYFLYKKLNPSEEEKAKKALEQEAEKYTDPVTGKKISCSGTLTHPRSQYQAWANNLYDAFIAGVGTDEDAVYDILNKMSTDCDIRQLIADFGLRRQEFSFSDDKNLTYFMRDELNASELSYANRILRTKGISFQF